MKLPETPAERVKAAVTTQRMARKTDAKVEDRNQCWELVPHWGGGGGSRYFGPSFYQCGRAGVWEVSNTVDPEEPRYCAQHARKHGLLKGNEPAKGVTRRTW